MKSLFAAILLLSCTAASAEDWNVLVKTYDGKVSLIKGIGSEQLCKDTACMTLYGQTCAEHDKSSTAWVTQIAAEANAVFASYMKTHGCLWHKPKDIYDSASDIMVQVAIEYRETPKHFWCPVEGSYSSGAIVPDNDKIQSAECFK